MVKIFKNRQPGGNGEFVIQTDNLDAEKFAVEFGTAFLVAVQMEKGDEEFTIEGLFPKAFDIAFKLAGYKAERVHEQRLLTCGHSMPSECELLADTNEDSVATAHRIAEVNANLEEWGKQLGKEADEADARA